MRANVFRNKWLGLLVLAVALAGVTKMIGGAQRAVAPQPEPAPVSAPPAPAAAPAAPAPAAAQTVEASEDDLIDAAAGDDASGFDPTPAAEPTGDKAEESDGPVAIVPENPVGIDPTPSDS